MFKKFIAPTKVADKKKLFTLILALIVVIAFVAFLFSLKSDSDTVKVEPQQESGELSIDTGSSGLINEPAAKRYDYSNSSSPEEEIVTPPEKSPFDALDKKPDINTSVTKEPVPVTPVTPTEEKAVSGAVLYCDSFADRALAESHKAQIAFMGIVATVVERDGSFKLKVGPFANRTLAKEVFSKLGDNSLVSSCSLVDE